MLNDKCKCLAEIRLNAGYPASETGYPAGYRIPKKAGYLAGRIFGATLCIMLGRLCYAMYMSCTED